MARATKVQATKVKGVVEEAASLLFDAMKSLNPNLTEDQVLHGVGAMVEQLSEGRPSAQSNASAEDVEQPEYNQAADLILAAYGFHGEGDKKRALTLVAYALELPDMGHLAAALHAVNSSADVPDVDGSETTADADEDGEDSPTLESEAGALEGVIDEVIAESYASGDDDDDDDDDSDDDDDEEDDAEEASVSKLARSRRESTSHSEDDEERDLDAVANKLSIFGRPEDRRLAAQVVKREKSATGRF